MFGKKKPTEKKASVKNTNGKKTKGEKSSSLQTPRPLSRSAVSSASPIPRGTQQSCLTPKTPDEFLFISNEAHYGQVIERIKTVKKTLWIGTADIKDLYVKTGETQSPCSKSFLILQSEG